MNRRRRRPSSPIKKIVSTALVLGGICALSIWFIQQRKAPPPVVELPEFSQVEPAFLNTAVSNIHSQRRHLITAVNNSIHYYRKLPKTRTFEYGDRSYTRYQMIKSMRLFKKILLLDDPAQIHAQLSEKFYYFQSQRPTGKALFTGYYVPIIGARKAPKYPYTAAVLSRPKDLVSANLGQFSDSLKGVKIFGKVVGDRFIPYDTRDEIMYKKSLNKRTSILGYVDPVDLFFLQIQGSGILRYPNGNMVRVGYAAKNGRPYRSISQLVKQIDPSAKLSSPGLMSFLKENRKKVRDIFKVNPSYVFFRPIKTQVVGSIGVQLTPFHSIACDARVLPKGSLAFYETDIPVDISDDEVKHERIQNFAVIQDTGGAIRGHGRVDIFWGSGPEAGQQAGHMKRNGKLIVFVAKKEYL